MICSLVRSFLSDPSPIFRHACHSLTHSLTNCCLVNLMPLNDANGYMMLQQLLKAVKRLSMLEMLLMLMMRIVLGAEVWL